MLAIPHYLRSGVAVAVCITAGTISTIWPGRAVSEEVAYLLRVPTWSELVAYQCQTEAIARLPAPLKGALELLAEKGEHPLAGAVDVADRLMASFGSMLLY